MRDKRRIVRSTVFRQHRARIGARAVARGQWYEDMVQFQGPQRVLR